MRGGKFLFTVLTRPMMDSKIFLLQGQLGHPQG
jgi:hypothetical protein